MIDGIRIGDLHSHALINMLYLRKDLGKRRKPPLFWNPLRNHIDLPRLREGGVDFQVFTIYVPFGFPWRTPFLAARAQVRAFEEFIEKNSQSIGHAKTVEDIRSLNAQGKIAALLAVEGGHHLAGRVENLEYFRDKGAIYMTMTHFVDNGVAGACFTGNKGLTEFGKEVVTAMERLGIAPDVAHCSEKAFSDVVDRFNGPVFFTHGGVRKFCNVTRNLSDDQVKAIGRKKGLTGVMFHSWYLKRRSLMGGIAQIVDTAKHIRDLVGAGTLCIGSDMDGYIWTVRGIRDVTSFPRVVEALAGEFPPDDVKAMAGENILRVLAVLRR